MSKTTRVFGNLHKYNNILNKMNYSHHKFTTRMRKETKEIHSISDALVNAKLAFALSENTVWAEGLLVFYEIFRFLELALTDDKSGYLSKLFTDDLKRTEAFEKDLNFYLGSNWTQGYKRRESVVQYLDHLQKLKETEPDLLMAYMYHLYMGLLSGGQILRKKRNLLNKIKAQKSNTEGMAVTTFSSGIFTLKKHLRDTMNDIASELDDDVKMRLIEESKKVFELNNAIIKTISGTTAIFLKKLVLLIVSLFVIYLAFYLMK